MAKPRTPKGRARLTVERLAEVYPGTAAELCALDFDDPFQLLAATILSAQSTDARVNMVTPALFAAYPDAAALAAAEPRGRGGARPLHRVLPGQDTSLIGMASAVADRFGGVVPTELEDLVTIPGRGSQDGQRRAQRGLRAPGPPRRHPRAAGERAAAT